MQPDFSANIESNFNETFVSIAFLNSISLTAPQHSESAVVEQNSCCYSVIKFIDY